MYLSYIDGIRAFAVIAVIIYHMNPSALPGGFSGVDVFFVVSGYVVSLSLDKHKDLRLASFLALFYSRRIKRIIPAL
ncbi:MAG: acyltransferase family protein, partial [Desulfuromonadales bacterium]|nr:acyltransferase family protein [Desulfuromonadales bacterium]